MHLVPLTVEQAKGCGRCNFRTHRLPEGFVFEYGFQRIALQTERRLPALQAFHGVGRCKSKVHRQRAARHLAYQAVTACVGAGDVVQVFENRLGVGAVVQQCGNHHGPARLPGHVFQKGNRHLPTLGHHVNAFALATHGFDQCHHFTVTCQPRRHGQAAFTVVCRAGAAGKTDSASSHCVTHDGLHLLDFWLCCFALRSISAHDPGAY